MERVLGVGGYFVRSDDPERLLDWYRDVPGMDLDATLGQVRASGSTVSDEIVEMDGVGRFAWVTDPDGRRVELWQPAD